MIINKLSIEKFCHKFVRNGKSQKSIDNVFDKTDNVDFQLLTKTVVRIEKLTKCVFDNNLLLIIKDLYNFVRMSEIFSTQKVKTL